MSEQDRSHELLILWMNLKTAIGCVRRSRKRQTEKEIVPWACRDKNVKLAWRELTAPDNLNALEEWLEVASRAKSRIWTQKAIKECKRRLPKKRRPSGSG